MATTAPHPGALGAARSSAPRRAAGLELLGRYEDSGFKEPPYLVRRRDGQVVQLSQLLYLVAEAADGTRDEEGVAAYVTERLGRRLTGDDARMLMQRKLRPLGVLAGADGSTPALDKRAAALALRHRRPFVGERTVRRMARVLQPLFHAPVVLLVLTAIIALDAWLFFDHGVAGPLRSAFYQPALLLAVFGATIAATAFHELGHAAACRFGGARPGPIGAGFYLIWPAFYCDVTDSYRLSRRGRLRTDLGGVYFNAIFSLLAAGAYFATGVEALLLVVVTQHFVVAQQLLPLLRFDGYYVLTDLTGVPDILSRVRPILRSLLPWREPEPAVQELKPWVRTVTTLYLATVVPLIVALVGWVVLGAPRLVATVADSAARHAREAAAAAQDGDWAASLLAGLEGAALLLPCLAIGLALLRVAQLLAVALRRWTRGQPRRRAAATVGLALAATFLTASWWPDGDYTPLRAAERGTVAEVFSSPLQVARTAGVAPAAESGGAASASRGEAVQAPDREQAEGGEDRSPVRRPAAGTPEEGAAADESPAGAADESPAGASPAAGRPAAEPTPTPSPIAQPGEGDLVNRASAVNTVDGARLFELAFAIQRVSGVPVTHQNIAEAFASCQACRTIAIAVQVVIVMGSSQLAAPVNIAESVNAVCDACQTLALAWQLVVMTPGEVEFTQEALRRILEIEQALATLERSDAPVSEIRAAADALLADLRETVLQGLVPAGEPVRKEPRSEEQSATAVPSPSPTATPQPTASPQPTATPEPTAEPSPEPTQTAEPTPEPTQTAEPTPTADAP